MPITQEASGAQTAVIGTPHTLATLATNKTFIAYVRCGVLAAGEYVQLKLLRDVRTADPTEILHSRTVSWLEAAVTSTIRLPAESSGGGEYVLQLTQLNGSGKTFAWSIETPG